MGYKMGSMTKDDYIKYWLETSEEDWRTTQDLYLTAHYLQALFFAHLTLEKLCKALWVKYNETNHPPRIHNLVALLKQTPIAISEDKLDFLLIFNDFQLEGRYPDYQGKLYRLCNQTVKRVSS